MTRKVKPLIYIEQLEPRIMLSGDSLLNIAPNPDQDTILDNPSKVVQEAELLHINEQVEEQISLEMVQSDTPNTEAYKPILTLYADDDRTSEQSSDADLSVENIAGLPGLELVDPNPSNLQGQVVYLDFDGAQDVTYNGPVVVEGIDIPEFSAKSAGLAGQEQAIISQIISSLEQQFEGTGVLFTTIKPDSGTSYSTIFVGGVDTAFTEYGSFLGLADQIDIGNKDHEDNAFVFSESIMSGTQNADQYAVTLAQLIAHETGHLLGYAHDFVSSNSILSHLALKVYFADPNLKAAVEAQLGVSNPTDVDMLGLTSLDASGRGITDLTGIKYGVNLANLDLGNNQLIDISPLSGLTNLTVLDLSNNQLIDIGPLSGLINIEELRLNNNQISDISPLSGLINIEELRLNNNQISDISPISGLTNLTYLELGNNQLSNIKPISGLKNLVELGLSENQISNISPISGLKNLTYLYLFNNQISDIGPLSGLTNLGSLALGNNQLIDISPLSGLTNLWGLELLNNQISDISPLSGLKNLTYLYLFNNQISDISPLSGLTNLWYLYLGSNQLSDISPLSGLTSLTFLNLRYNQISDIGLLSGLINLEGLRLNNNQISDISPLSGLINIEELKLNNNQISDISPISGLTNFTHLDLTANPLNGYAYNTYIPQILANNPAMTLLYDPDQAVYFADPNLKAAVEAQLGVSDPTAVDMLGLTSLDAQNRGITDLTGLEYGVNLTSLYLHSNQISNINPLSGLTNLAYLTIGNNQIIDINPLSGLTNLAYLFLDNNQISDISPISGLMNFTHLDLTANPLNGYAYNTYIPQILANNPGMTLLYDPDQAVYFADPNLKAAVEAQLGVSDPTAVDMLGLTYLDAGDMGIIDLTGLEYGANLTELYLYDNQLSDISLISGLTGLWYLYLDGNQISEIGPLSGLTNLTNLYLRINQISDINPLSGLTNMTSLALDVNQLSDINPLSGLTNLTYLGLSSNQISDINPLSGLTNLTNLGLSINQISDIGPLSGLINLEELRFYNNQISDISPLSGLINLEDLRLHNNQISDISPLSGLTNFTDLDLRFNPLNGEAYIIYIPQILTNNPGITLLYDPNEFPVLDTNTGITVNEGYTEVIDNTELQVTDDNNTADELQFTLIAVPTNGVLKLGGTTLSVSDTFTQTDIDGGLLTYEHDGSETTNDSFQFSVSDGSGGSIGDTTFNINITIIAIKLDFDSKGKAQFYDADGDLVRVSLKGAGTGTLYFAQQGNCDIDQIVLTGTNSKSSLTITAKGSSNATTVNNITVHGSLKSLTGKTTDLLGDIAFNGSVKTLTLDDIADNHAITIGPSSNPKAAVTLKFDQVTDLVLISAIPIKKLTATFWLGGSLSTPRISNLAIKGTLNAVIIITSADTKGVSLKLLKAGNVGTASLNAFGGVKTIKVDSWADGLIDVDWIGTFVCKGHLGVDMDLWQDTKGISLKKLKADSVGDILLLGAGGIKNAKASVWMAAQIQVAWIGSLQSKGDFETDVILTGADRKGIALNKLTVKGRIIGSDIQARNGSINTLTAGAIRDSSCFVGTVSLNDNNGDGVYDLPDSFLTTNSLFINKLTVKGIKGSSTASFVNSNIAALYIKKISLAYPQYDNGGVPFGILADYIKKFTGIDSEGKWSFSNLSSPADSSQNQDAEVRIV